MSDPDTFTDYQYAEHGDQILIGKDVLAFFRLPIPFEEFGLFASFIDRVYGTHSMMEGLGPFVAVVPGPDGLGPRVTSPISGEPPESEGLLLNQIMTTPEGVSVEIDQEGAQQILAQAAQTFLGILDAYGAKNYLEMKFRTPSEESYAIRVQKLSGLSPADKVALAEAESERLRSLLIAHGIDPTPSASNGDGNG